MIVIRKIEFGNRDQVAAFAKDIGGTGHLFAVHEQVKRAAFGAQGVDEGDEFLIGPCAPGLQEMAGANGITVGVKTDGAGVERGGDDGVRRREVGDGVDVCALLGVEEAVSVETADEGELGVEAEGEDNEQ